MLDHLGMLKYFLINIKANIASKYHLPAREHDGLSPKEKNDDSAKKRRKRPVVDNSGLLEDLDLLEPDHLRPIPFGMESLPIRPELNYNFHPSLSTNSLVFLAIKIFSFLNIYGQPLKLYPFQFDDFLQSLSNNEMNDDLIGEIFGCLLTVACDFYQLRFDYNSGFNPLYIGFPKKVSGKYSEDQAEQEAIEPILNNYGKFKVIERVAVDQWYKWRPGQWGVSKKIKGQKGVKSSEYLKAWQVALFGLIKDCFYTPQNDNMAKWRILGCLLNLGSQDDPIFDEKMTIENHINEEMAEQIVNEMVVDPAENEIQPDEVKKVKKVKKTKEHTEVRRSSRRLNSKLSDNEDDENLPRRTSTRVSRNSLPSKTAAIVETPVTPKNKPNSKSVPNTKSESKNNTEPKTKHESKEKIEEADGMGFEELCEITENGFLKISASDKIAILNFLIEEFVSESEILKNFRDESSEKVIELKKEQREIAKERKHM